MIQHASVLSGLAFFWFTLFDASAATPNGNEFTPLDGADPFYPNIEFPKLTTPQWVGATNVDAVVILGIDDMGANTAPYEQFLRPIIERLKRIDGRAPISIFCNAIAPDSPQIQAWLKEGLSMEVHTLTHPCPILGKNDLRGATNTFHGGVDLVNQVPGNRPVAFRTPCCDSINSPSPRFYAEIFNRPNAAGQFLEIDSSVMVSLTSRDPALPKALTLDQDGRERFLRYLPFPSFSTTIENYPYPYVLGRLCWEFPAMVPSDWEAQHVQGQSNPVTLQDWKIALDAAVIKQGVFNFIFHPHNRWSSSGQFVEFIDYAVSRYGNKVLFLNFKEALDRLNLHLLGGQSLRDRTGSDNGVRLADLDGDGFLDVLIGNGTTRSTRTWDPVARKWLTSELPTAFVESPAPGLVHSSGTRLGILSLHGKRTPLLMTRSGKISGAWIYTKPGWRSAPELLEGLSIAESPVLFSRAGVDFGALFRDVDHNGSCELIVANPSTRATLEWVSASNSWKPLAKGAVPADLTIVNEAGQDNGVRFVDINNDGYEDLIVSNEEGFSLHLYVPRAILGWMPGWTREVFRGKRGSAWEIPAFVRSGSFRNNGAWFRNQHLWVQNEQTSQLPDLVDRRPFSELLRGPLPRPLTPEESLSKIRIQDGLRIELIAHEPLIQSPVAIDWDARGRLWVVENRDYPSGINANAPPSSTIKVLVDKDGDGRFDAATEFLGGLNYANGLLHWKKGVLISAAPHILFAEDLDGDDRADRTTVLYDGFKEGNPQHRVNGFELGLDNWIYGANGDSGGLIRRGQSLGPSINISGRDFRFRPESGEFQTQAGMSQFGRHRDDWGNWFGNNNGTMAYHFPFPEHYLARNPSLVFRSMRRFLGQAPDGGKIYPISTQYQRFNLVGDADRYTSANSPAPYRDSLLGAGFTNALFISEPVNNLIHRELLEPDGVTFRSRRADSELRSEFIASSDPWFRPLAAKTGPDSALYFVDMYRLILEHPEWIPDDVEKVMDLRAGAASGRIYRVKPASAGTRPIPNLDGASSEDLCAFLESPNGWVRDTSQRLLIDRMMKSVDRSQLVSLLKRLASGSAAPLGRLHALCTLEGAGELTLEVTLSGCKDPHPGVREHAVRLLEPYLRTPQGSAAIRDAMTALAQDPEIRVRYQVAFSVGEAPPSTEFAEILARLAVAHSDSAFLQAAVLSSSSRMPEKVLKHLVQLETRLDRVEQTVTHLTRAALPSLSPQDRRDMARSIIERGQHGLSAADLNTLATLEVSLSDDSVASLESLTIWRGAIREILGDSAQPSQKVAAAIRLLRNDQKIEAPIQSAIESKLELVSSPEVQDAVIEWMSSQASRAAWAAQLQKLPRLAPAVSRKILDQTLRRRESILVLLELLEGGALPPDSLPAATRAHLVAHPAKDIQTKAAALLGHTRDTPRKQIVQQTAALVDRLQVVPANGSAVFQKTCAVCHAFGDPAATPAPAGRSLGPNLASLVDRSTSRLLTSILDPNEAVEDRYKSFTATLANGDELTGVVLEESANSITLGTLNGDIKDLLRTQIKSLQGGSMSLMPEGFETGLTPQDLADLLSFLRQPSHRPRGFEGNVPSITRPSAGGSIVLKASAAEIFGETLAFESTHQNLGMWSGERDQAVWSIETPGEGVYDVELVFACPAETAGNLIAIQASGATLLWPVAATGSWDHYQRARAGQIVLPQGASKLVAKAGGKVRGHLIDLKEILLKPSGSK